MKSILLLIGTAFMSLTAGASTISFTDTTFNLANYSATSVFKSDPANTFSFAQCPHCGNPGKALNIHERFPKSFSFTAVGFANNTFAYNPLTQGAILSINASTDKNIITNAPQLPSGQFYSNTFRPLIEQDGMFYLAMISGPTFTHGGATGFNTISQDSLVATDFTQFDFSTGTFGTAHPNFAGDPILLGLGQLTTFGPHVNFRAIYDNLSFTINNRVPDSGSTLLLLLASVAALLAWRTLSRELPAN